MNGFRAIDRWLPGYVAAAFRRPRRVAGERHLLFCVADHFEPFRKRLDLSGKASGGRDRGDAVRLVREWTAEYRRSVEGLADADGVPPRHTFFYPAEEYDEECLDLLAEFSAAGFGEVEIHLHHRNDTAEGLRETLAGYRDTLRNRHGLLGSDGEDRVRYGFVHGNWALCNSRPDGDWCGVNEELGILAQTGCFADFTFPSAPSPTQPRMVNSLYRAVDSPGRPRGHDKGEILRAGRFACTSKCTSTEDDTSPENRTRTRTRTLISPFPNSLLLVQGPLALDWKRRKWGVVPRLENAEISGSNPPGPARVRLWLSAGIHVQGRPEWVFVKVHTHGCVDENRAMLFGESMRAVHETPGMGAGDEWRVHYVTAREMYNIARAAEDGATGNPSDVRDYEVRSPFAT